ncbi:MAG TPA: hypothetical protein VLM85_16565 [Polyangiaceae bacterium]|nr:hypothetical protein [Polyangiaceae bacterium]
MNIRTVTVVLLPLGLVSAIACSSVSAKQACSDLATAVCAKVEQCAPVILTSAYGDTTTCIARAELSCNQSLALTNTSDTPSFAESCAQAWGSLSCADAFQNNPPKACQQTPGPLAAGAACGTAGQCASDVCLAGASGCGTCGSAAAAGAACKATGDCADGLVCAADATNALRCVAPAASGADCTNTPCQAGLVCAGATGAKKCAAPLAAGSACDPATQGCDSAAGYWCTPRGTRCVEIKFAGSGQPCGYDTTTGDLTECSDSGFCVLAAQSTLGTCLAAAADGAPCDNTKGPRCVPPATCNNGTCTITDPATCK